MVVDAAAVVGSSVVVRAPVVVGFAAKEEREVIVFTNTYREGHPKPHLSYFME